MVTTDELKQALESGGNVIGIDGSKIGSIGQVFLDDETAQPEWVTAKTGMFGGAESFIPLRGASVSGHDIQVPFDKTKVKDAPRVDDSEGHLSRQEESELYRFYEMDYAEPHSRSNESAARDEVADGRGSEHDTSGHDTDEVMTRSEERLAVGTEKVSTGKVRLRKYVVTENVTKTVPVSHEEVRIEREPITDANRGDVLANGDITEEEHEIELQGERVVVDKQVAPVERVRMGKDVVTDDQQISEEVRKEQIDTDADSEGSERR